MKTPYSILSCLLVLAFCFCFAAGQDNPPPPPNPPGQEQWEERMPPIFRGTFEGMMNSTEMMPNSTDVRKNSGPAYLTFIQNIVLSQNSGNSTFLGMVKVNPNQNRLIVVGLDHFEGKDNRPDDQRVKQISEMCIWAEDGPDKFRMACGRDRMGRPIFPLGFNDTQVIHSHFDMKRGVAGSIPREYEGTYIAEMTKNGTNGIAGNLIMNLVDGHLTVLEKQAGRPDFGIFVCQAMFNTTSMPQSVSCHKKIFDKSRPEQERIDMIYRFNSTGPDMKMFTFAFNKEGAPLPKDFETAENSVRAWSNRASMGLEGAWFGRVRDFNTGMPDTPIVVEFRNTTMFISTQFFRSINLFRTEPPRPEGQSIMHVLGVETANPTPEKPNSNMKFDYNQYVYEIKNVDGGRRLLQLCFRDRQKSDQPPRPPAPFKCGDEGVQMIELSNVKIDKNPVELFNVAPNFGRSGTKIVFGMRLRPQNSRRRAFETCPGNMKIFFDKLEVQDLQCDLAKNEVSCVAPTSTRQGPHRISVQLNGFTFDTPAVFNFVPENAGDATSASRIVPNRLPLSGAPIHIPIRNADNLSGQAITVTIEEQPCTNVTVKDKAIRCIAPAMTSPGEYFVSVQVGSVYAVVSEKVLYNSDNQDVKLGPATPNVVAVAGGQGIALPLFIKDADGSVPADLVTSVTVSGIECTNPTIQAPTGDQDKQRYLVKCDTPAATSAGRADVLFTVVLNGNTYVGKSQITYANADATKNVQIFKIDPKFGSSAGGSKITIHCRVPTSSFVTRFVTAETIPSASVTIGGIPCVVSETSFDKSQGIGKVVCTAPAMASGTYNVEVTLPGGSSITRARYTFTSESQPKISNISPSRISSTESGTYTITGSNFAPPTKRRSLFQRAVSAVDCSSVSVSLGADSCSNVVCTSNTELSATCPPAVSGGDSSLVVSVNGESSPSDSSVTGAGIVQVTSATQPSITSISPATGDSAGGTTITVTGTNFGTSATDLSFTIAGNTCTDIKDVTDTSFKCTTPLGSTGDASVVASRAGDSSFATSGKWTYTGSEPGDDPQGGSASTARVAIGALVAAACLVFMM